MTTTLSTPLPTGQPPLRPGNGRTVIRVLIVAAAALLILGSLGILTAASIGLGNTRVITDSQPLPAGMRTLTVDTGRLPVSVRITAEDDVTEPRVDMRFIGADSSGQQTLAVSAEGADARLTINADTAPDDFGWTRAGEITLVLPAELARRLSVTSTQEFGVLLADADIDRLVARTTNGAIILRGAARSIDVEATHGTINSRDPITVRESFVARATEGDISVDFTQGVPETIEATTANGSIEIGLPSPGPYTVTAQSGVREASEISVDQTSDPAEAAATVTAESTTGSVTVSYTNDEFARER